MTRGEGSVDRWIAGALTLTMTERYVCQSKDASLIGGIGGGFVDRARR